MHAEEAVALLQSMFESWDRDSLITMLQMNHGHVENTIEMILKMEGDSASLSGPAPAPDRTKLSPDTPTTTGPSTGDLDQMLARQMSLEDDETAPPTAVSVLHAAREPDRSAGCAPSMPSSRLAAAAVEAGATSASSAQSRMLTKDIAKAAEASAQRGRRGINRSRRGTPIELPPDFLRLPARFGSVRNNATSTRRPAGQSRAQEQQASIDAELAMMIQNELVAQQLAEEEARANANPLNMLGELVYGGLQQINPSAASSSRGARSSSAAGSSSHQGEQRYGAAARDGLTPGATGRAQPSMATSDSVSSKASSFFSSFGEDVKRKITEVGVKIQAATGTGGYATTDNDGTSCGIEEEDEDDALGTEERLRRRHGPVDGATSAGLREGPPSTSQGRAAQGRDSYETGSRSKKE